MERVPGGNIMNNKSAETEFIIRTRNHDRQVRATMQRSMKLIEDYQLRILTKLFNKIYKIGYMP